MFPKWIFYIAGVELWISDQSSECLLVSQVTTGYSLWVPDERGHKCYPRLFLSNRPLTGYRGRQPQITANVPAKPSAVSQAFSQFLCIWLLAGLQIFQLFDLIYISPPCSPADGYMLARLSQARTGYLASLCFLIVLFLQKLLSAILSFLNSVALCFFTYR